MKKFIVTLLGFCFMMSDLQAASTTIAFRVAGFYPTSDKFNCLYGDLIPCYAFEAGMPLSCSWIGWANIDWLGKHKRHSCFSSSHVEIVNGSFGVKYAYQPCDNWSVYLGGGLALGGVFLTNHWDGSRDQTSKFLVGGVVKSGVSYLFCNQIFVEGFVDYLYEPVTFEERINLGGIKIGVGLGYAF